MADRDVTVDILARDNTAPATTKATRGFDRLKDSVDRANRSLSDTDTATGKATSKVAAFAKKMVGLVGKAIGGAASLASNIGGGIVTAVMAVVVAGLAVQLAPAIGAAIVAGAAIGVGGALLAIGVLAVKSNAKIQSAFKRLGERVRSDLTAAAQPLVGPMVKAMRQLERLSRQMRPHLRGIFKDLAPVIPMLTKGLDGLVREMLPRLRAGVPGMVAGFRALSQMLPGIGKIVGDLVKDLLGNPKIIENTTRALLKLATWPLKLLGPLLSGLNVLFGVQANLVRYYGDLSGRLWPRLVAWLDGGTGAVGRLKGAWVPLWQAVQNVWDKLKAFAAASTPKEIETRYRALVQALRDAWGPLRTFIGTVWSEAWAFVKRQWNEVVVPWWNGTVKPWLDREIVGVIDRAFGAAADRAVSIIKAMVVSVLATLMPLPTAIARALTDRMRNAGSSTGNAFGAGLVDAINEAKGAAIAAARGVAAAAARAAQAAASAGTAGASFSAGSSWSAARFAATTLAAAPAGQHRTGGPTPVSVTSDVHVALDGRPFRQMTVTVVNAREKRAAWRDKVGRR